MTKLIDFIVALGLIGVSVLLLKALEQLAAVELRRRARGGQDRGIYQLESYGRAGRFILIFTGAMSFVWLVNSVLAAWWQSAIAIVLLTALAAGWTGPQPGSSLWRVADGVAGYLSKLLSWLPLTTHHSPAPIAKLYEKSDLIELLEHQLGSKDNRISPAEIKTAISVLNLRDKKVSDAMTPLAKAKLVPADEQIGPHLLNELHKFTSDCFIVVKGSAKSTKPEVIGTLYLADAADLSGGGSVRSIMHEGAEFIDEDLSLVQALGEFLGKKVHVLAVRNGFDELVGVLSLQLAIEAVLGSPRLSAKPQISIDGDKLTTDEKNTSQRVKS